MPINSFLYPGAKTTPAYQVSNSVRYNDGDSPKMERTTSAGSNTIGTFSCWVKRGALGTDQAIFTSTNDTVWFKIWFHNEDYLRIDRFTGSAFTLLKITDKKFRDTSSWYHIHIALDTTNGTAEDRMILTVNGTRVTSFASSTNSGSSDDLIIGTNTYKHRIGANQTSGDFFDGYLSEVVWIDGTALAVTNFGEFDEDSPTIWKPKNVSGLTFGTNGFYLDFEDSSALGNDVSGNDNDFTPTNLAATDQSTDTCTNNFATMNLLDVSRPSTFALSEGNLDALLNGFSSSGGNTYPRAFSTFQLTSGKWYAECKITEENDSGVIGISARSAISYVDIGGTNYDWLGINAHDYRYYHDGTKMNNNSSSSYGTTWDGGDTIGVALDLDNLAVYFSLNGTFQASGDPTSGSSRTNAAFNLTAVASTPNGAYKIGIGTQGDANQTQGVWNFGSPPYAISSGNSDANGYGNFEYSVPSGYYSLCTKNLAEFG